MALQTDTSEPIVGPASSPTAKLALTAFSKGFTSTGTKTFPSVAVLRAATKLKVSLRGIRDRNRYFDGEFRGQAIAHNLKMHLENHHKMHDELIDKAHSKVHDDILAHQKSTKATRELWLNNTYKETVRESRQKVVDQDNNLLLGRLYKTAYRRNQFDDAEFTDRYKRRKYARDFARAVQQHERAKHIDYDNQNMLRRLSGTQSVYSTKKWERDFKHSRLKCKLAAKVKAPKRARRPKHPKKFKAAVSATDMRKQLIPRYDSARDPFCKTYFGSKQNRAVIAKQQRLEMREERRQQRRRQKLTPKWRRKHK